VIGKGAAGTVPQFALQMQDASQLATYRRALSKTEDFSSPLFAEGAFSVTDPDGRRVAFGLPKENLPAGGMPGRLQHFVCATAQLPAMIKFYQALGMVESDRVLDKDELAASFLRSDPEHHSFAAFRAPEARADHHCYETNGWLDIR